MPIPQSPEPGQDRPRKKAICRHKRCCEREVMPKAGRVPVDESQPLQAQACEKAGYDRREPSPIASQKTCITSALLSAEGVCAAGGFPVVHDRMRSESKEPADFKIIEVGVFLFRKCAAFVSLEVSFLFLRKSTSCPYWVVPTILCLQFKICEPANL